MIYLLGGLILFFGPHVLPLFAAHRRRLIGRLGRWPYLGLFSLLSLAGLALIVRGYPRIEPVILWTPFGFARPLAHALMPVALTLVFAAYLSTHLKERLHHPMLIGVVIWAGVHLMANGDLASTLLFGPFLAYALIDMTFTRPRQTLLPKVRPWGLYDALAVILGLLAYGALLFGHARLFGVAVI